METNAVEIKTVNPQIHKITPESWDIYLTENVLHFLHCYGTAELF